MRRCPGTSGERDGDDGSVIKSKRRQADVLAADLSEGAERRRAGGDGRETRDCRGGRSAGADEDLAIRLKPGVGKIDVLRMESKGPGRIAGAGRLDQRGRNKRTGRRQDELPAGAEIRVDSAVGIESGDRQLG